MGSFINFKNFVETPQPEPSGGKQMGSNLPLARQSSIYSLTFDELQNTFGGSGKDFGSMNMEDLLKNIWTAEESQAALPSAGGGDEGAPDGSLQKQGSYTLPRTMSHKTVDEVWKDFIKESTAGEKDGGGAEGGSSFGHRQSTLGEMTLEEFLARAGVGREDARPSLKQNMVVFGGGLGQSNMGFQPPAQNQGLLSTQFLGNGNVVPNSSSIVLNMPQVQHQQQQPQKQPPPLFPKQTTVAFSSGMQLGNNGQLGSPGAKVPLVGMSNPSLSTSLVQGGVMQGGATGLAGLRNGSTPVAAAASVSPGSNISLDMSPSPYQLTEGGRGRRSGGSLEKVVERRRRRMIKNRESAARSRARKQAYTLELEAEVQKLKEINQKLQKKQAEFLEMQKNEMMETLKKPWGEKKRCLRRTLTGPW